MVNTTTKVYKMSLDKCGRIDRSFVKCGELRNCVYCIEIDNVIVYVGKAKDMWKRLDTYRNSKYWREANPSNILKTARLEMAIKKRKRVNLIVTTHDEDTYHDFEINMIRKINPEWNKQHYDKDNQKSENLIQPVDETV
ncbi:endonuclease [Klebsiella phage iPHaGe-KPN-11i]|nr:endonuclease [Klebsiella phage iPHaGe-KPN-12i]WOL25492.1 endonuclease [Klebsiella phage iPHaGe-KPN-11i]